MADCIPMEDKPRFAHILKEKIEALEEEKQLETDFYNEHGLYHEQDVADIEDKIEIAKRVLKNLDSLPVCK